MTPAPPQVQAPHVAVHTAGIVAVGQGLTLAQGAFKGDVVDANGDTVGFVAWPADGGVAITGPGLAFSWVCGQLDSDASGFVAGPDQDLFMEWWVLGSPMADWNMDGWVTGDDFDSHAEAWQKGTQP